MVAHLAKLSGMQKQVLSLYRGFLQAAQLKATVDRERIHSVVCVGYMFLHAVHILSFPFFSSATNLPSPPQLLIPLPTSTIPKVYHRSASYCAHPHRSCRWLSMNIF